MITKVTIEGMRQAVQMFGPAQAAVAQAVADSVEAGVILKDQCEDLVIVCGVFIHPQAESDQKIYDYNLEATKQAIVNAMTGKPTADEMIAQKDQVTHPFRGF
jgi:5,6,7,8-tetrahydromethanopterin hydro-lyase